MSDFDLKPLNMRCLDLVKVQAKPRTKRITWVQGLLFGLISIISALSSAAVNLEIETPSDSKVLVVYFSRSGNTELLAQEIARYYQAPLLPLKADDYFMGARGLFNAVVDSQGKRAVIVPEVVDLSAYDTLFIGAPIWRYSPAPPVWQFVESNNLAHKKVVLFSTFNSGFKQQYIDEFQASVEAQSGNFINHLYIRRGRMLVQMSSEDLLARAREKLQQLELK